jgi:hypothetical protein
VTLSGVLWCHGGRNDCAHFVESDSAVAAQAQGDHLLMDLLIRGFDVEIFDDVLQLLGSDGAVAISVGRVEDLAEEYLYVVGEAIGHRGCSPERCA